jgi:hypothetical protein
VRFTRIGLLRHLRRGALAAAVVTGLAPPALADTIEAVTTPRLGALTVCRSWVVYNSCTTYGKVPLPERIAVGDKVKLTYGTNPKDYIFHVVDIRRQDGRCTILSDASGGKENGEKLELTQCEASAKPAADSR